MKRKLMMKFEDKFSLPLEWISDETKRIVESCREIVEKEIIPIRHELDEDWKDHKIYDKLLKIIMLDFGLTMFGCLKKIERTQNPEMMP